MVYKKGEMLSNMLLFATQKHAGQFDTSGQPYILHPLFVMNLLETNDEDLQCIALGHDLVEDCKVTYQELFDMGFSSRVVQGIRDLTKVPGETKEDYKAKVKSNPDAIKVKRCDLRHNSDITRLKDLTPRNIERTIFYHEFYTELKDL